jgi:hypothetical protein
MPAAKAKRSANPKGSSAVTRPASAKRATRLREPVRTATRKASAAEGEAFNGPGYQFVGFRFMCRHRHVRH